MNPRNSILEKLFLIHRTDFCPVPEMKIGGTFISNLITGERSVSKDSYRSTLHWSFADVSPNVGYSIIEKNIEFNQISHGEKIWGNKGPKYIVLESIQAINDLIVGGWLDDLYMIGPYSLSEKSILIAPNNEVDELKNQGFSGKILSYDSTLTNSEDVFKKFISTGIEDFHLKITFPKTSNLSRIASQFGNEIANILKKNPSGLVISATFTLENGQISPIYFEKTDLQYNFITDKSGIDLCSALSIQSTRSLAAEPGETSIYFLKSGLEFPLKKIFSNMSWETIAHEKSPFGHLEKAILIKDIKRISNHLKEIGSQLILFSKPYEKYIRYRKFLIKNYGLELNEYPEENLYLSMRFLSNMNKKQIETTTMKEEIIINSSNDEVVFKQLCQLS